MVKDPESRRARPLDLSEALSTGGEHGTCSVLQGTCAEGGKPLGEVRLGCQEVLVQCRMVGLRPPGKGFVSRDLVGCVGYRRPSSILGSLLALVSTCPPHPPPRRSALLLTCASPWVFFSLPGAHSRPGWEMRTSLLGDLIFIFPLPEGDFCAFGFQGQGCVVPPTPPPREGRGGGSGDPSQTAVFPLDFSNEIFVAYDPPSSPCPPFSTERGDPAFPEARPEPTLVEIGDVLQGPGA